MTKTKTADDMAVKILSFDAAKLKDAHYTITEADCSFYTNTLDFTLETEQLQKTCKKYCIPFSENKKFKTKIADTTYKCSDAIITVTFNNCYKQKTNTPETDDKTNKSMSKLELRKELYINGFTYNDAHYVQYKHTSSQAREGKTFFINDILYDDMMKWTYGNLPIRNLGNTLDLGGLSAYESLTLSGIEDVVKIPKNAILIIDDATCQFNQMVSCTRLKNADKEATASNIAVFDEAIEVTNTVWDGQSLLDVSIFADAGRSDKGMMLLRNKFFKSCAFNCNIQQYFKDNDIEYVTDMFGKKHKAEYIKLITTPSSIKLKKFAEYMSGNWYAEWLKLIENKFGIVKSEHATKFHFNVNQLSYQYINSLPLTFEEVDKLSKYEAEYIYQLCNNNDVFFNFIGTDGRVNGNRDFAFNMISANHNYLKTEEGKKYRSSILNNYKIRLCKGKIKLPDTDYCTLCGNPYEMLQAATGITDISQQKHIHTGYQVWCSRFPDHTQLSGFRSPHICAGNVISVNNVHSEVFDKYFNFTDNIVAVNGIDADIMNRGQGLDYDSDMMLLTSDPLLVNKGIECQQYLTPVNNIPADKTVREYTPANKATVDDIIANNNIGEIVNLSQELNSQYWQNKTNGGNEKLLQIIYDDISLLSTLSQIEIDRAKKSYSFNTQNILKNIYKRKYNDKYIIPRTEKFATSFENLPVQANIYDVTFQYLSTIVGANNEDSYKKAYTAAKNKEHQEKCVKWLCNFNTYDDFCSNVDNDVINKFYNEYKKEVRIRPYFLKVINDSISFSYDETLQCPMNYLIQAVRIAKKMSKSEKNSKTIKFAELLELPTIGQPTCTQIKTLYEMAVKLQAYNNKKQAIKDKKSKQQDFEEEIYTKLDKMKINQNTMAFVVKQIYLPERVNLTKADKANKVKNKYDYRKYGKTLTSLLYRNNPEMLLSFVKDDASTYKSKLIENITGNISLFGKKYKVEKF